MFAKAGVEMSAIAVAAMVTIFFTIPDPILVIGPDNPTATIDVVTRRCAHQQEKVSIYKMKVYWSAAVTNS
jgi:hypothetical protein